MCSLDDPWVYGEENSSILGRIREYTRRIESQLDKLRRVEGGLERMLDHLRERLRRLTRTARELRELKYDPGEILRETMLVSELINITSLSLEVVRFHIEYLESERELLVSSLGILERMDEPKLSKLVRMINTCTIPIRLIPTAVNILHLAGYL